LTLLFYFAEYSGGRGSYKLIRKTWKWLNEDLGLEEEAQSVAKVCVRPDGGYAYE